MTDIDTRMLDRELKKGSAELIILSIVEPAPRHGYEISRLIETRSGGRLKFNVASLYPLVSARVAVHMSEGQTIRFPAPEIVVDANAELGSAFGAACLMHQDFISRASEAFSSDESPGTAIHESDDQ